MCCAKLPTKYFYLTPDIRLCQHRHVVYNVWTINIFMKTAEFIISVKKNLICAVIEEILMNVINIRARFQIYAYVVAS